MGRGVLLNKVYDIKEVLPTPRWVKLIPPIAVAVVVIHPDYGFTL